MAVRGATRTQVLATAQRLFARQGYHATGVNQILGEAAAPKGSLYFHFPGGKQQLAAEAVGLGARELGEVISEVIDRSADPASAIRTMTDLLARRLEDSDFLDGCPIAAVALDASTFEPVREVCWAGYAGWLASISEQLRDSGVAEDEAAELGLLVLSALEGALLLARTRRDTTLLRHVGERVATTIEQATATPAGS